MGYRYGFNGKEKDESGEWGNETHYDYGFRIYNPGIARFLSVDPLKKSFPWYTPYQFAGNTPIIAVDLDGKEIMLYDEGKDPQTTALNIKNAEQINFDVFVGNQTQGGLDAAPPIPTFELNPETVFISRQELYRKEAEQFSGEINRRRDVAEKTAKFEQQKARNSNFIATMYDVSDISDGVSIAKDIAGGDYQSAAITASLFLLPAGIDKAARQIPFDDLVKGVNKTKGCSNCSDAALAVDRRMKGDLDAVAKADAEVSIYGVNSSYKDRFGPPEVTTTVGKFGDIVQGIKSGETGIITISPSRSGDGHAFNITNQGGTIKILDGQTEQVISIDQLRGYLSRFDESTGAQLYNTTNKTN